MSRMPPSNTAQQPTKPLSYPDALNYLERWIEAEILTAEERNAHIAVSIVDYLDRNPSTRTERPWCGVRVAEVDFHTEDAGASYMQVEVPIALAICAQAERCILALVEGWNKEARRTGSYDTDEEFERLRSVFAHAGHRAPAAEANETAASQLTEPAENPAPPADVVRCVVTETEVRRIAEREGVPVDVALERAREWANIITDRASMLVNEQLGNVVRSDTL